MASAWLLAAAPFGRTPDRRLPARGLPLASLVHRPQATLITTGLLVALTASRVSPGALGRTLPALWAGRGTTSLGAGGALLALRQALGRCRLLWLLATLAVAALSTLALLTTPLALLVRPTLRGRPPLLDDLARRLERRVWPRTAGSAEFLAGSATAAAFLPSLRSWLRSLGSRLVLPVGIVTHGCPST